MSLSLLVSLLSHLSHSFFCLIFVSLSSVLSLSVSLLSYLSHSFFCLIFVSLSSVSSFSFFLLSYLCQSLFCQSHHSHSFFCLIFVSLSSVSSFSFFLHSYLCQSLFCFIFLILSSVLSLSVSLLSPLCLFLSLCLPSVFISTPRYHPLLPTALMFTKFSYSFVRFVHASSHRLLACFRLCLTVRLWLSVCVCAPVSLSVCLPPPPLHPTPFPAAHCFHAPTLLPPLCGRIQLQAALSVAVSQTIRPRRNAARLDANRSR